MFRPLVSRVASTAGKLRVSTAMAQTRLFSTTPGNGLISSETPHSMSYSTAVLEEEDVAERIRASKESQRANTIVLDGSIDKATTTISENDNESKQPILADLAKRVEEHAWSNKIEKTSTGERAFFLDSIPTATLDVYQQNSKATADWLQDIILSPDASKSVLFYIGFEVFYDPNFDALLELLREHDIPIQFSSMVKSTQDYIQDKARYNAMETNKNDWENRVIVHFGASHAMDRLLFQEDGDGRLQTSWKEGRLVILSPEVTISDQLVYRAGLSRILQMLVADNDNDKTSGAARPATAGVHKQVVEQCDYNILDKEIADTKRRVEEGKTMEDVFTELYRLVVKYVERGQLDSPCYWDSGWESFHMYKSVSQSLATDDMKLPWSRVGLINSRNAAIGDSLHAFYATSPQAFPFVVCGDTAALLAGGISMINIHAQNRFGVVVIPNNRGMAIEDVISKRSVDGHQFQYEYVKLDRKRDIFTLAQLKEVVKNEVLASLRDHLWGVSSHRAGALVLNVDVQSLRKENADNADTDAVLMGSSFLDEDFGDRYAEMEGPRRRLESIVNVLHSELNTKCSNGNIVGRGSLPVRIQGCSAIEFMEIFSQLSITHRDKLKFLPTPTDLLATRTLLPSLLESNKRIVSSSGVDSNFVNSNGAFSVFVSNAAFGLDGLNNVISTHLEYGTGTLIHLAYDAADVVTHYSLLGQVHRNFGTRPSNVLPSLYRNHQAYEGQIMTVDNSANEADVSSAILDGLQNPDVKVILVDMGAPNLTAALK